MPHIILKKCYIFKEGDKNAFKDQQNNNREEKVSRFFSS